MSKVKKETTLKFLSIVVALADMSTLMPALVSKLPLLGYIPLLICPL